MQATLKLPILSAMVHSATATKSAALDPDEDVAVYAYWTFVVALVLNAVYPVFLLQFASPQWQRDLSMGLDAFFDAVYSASSSFALHFVVGAASAPSNFLLYGSTFYPTFHIFTGTSPCKPNPHYTSDVKLKPPPLPPSPSQWLLGWSFP